MSTEALDIHENNSGETKLARTACDTTTASAVLDSLPSGPKDNSPNLAIAAMRGLQTDKESAQANQILKNGLEINQEENIVENRVMGFLRVALPGASLYPGFEAVEAHRGGERKVGGVSYPISDTKRELNDHEQGENHQKAHPAGISGEKDYTRTDLTEQSKFSLLFDTPSISRVDKGVDVIFAMERAAELGMISGAGKEASEPEKVSPFH